MKKVINIVIVVAVMAAIVLVLKRNKNANQEKTDIASIVSTSVPVQIDVVKEETFTTSFSSNGLLEPMKTLTQVSEVSGRVKSILIEKGQRVSKGQVLIYVDDALLRADFKSSEAAYNSLKTDYERFQNANESGGVSTQQLDNIRTQLVAAESRYISSKRRLEDATVRAPMSGIINERYIEEGAYINPGARLFDIVDVSKLKMRSNITAKMVLKVSVGQIVAIKCDVLPGVELQGSISFIGAVADRGLNFPIEIVIAQKDDLKAGMYVSAQFESEEELNALLIPRNAVSGSVKSASVFVVKGGVATKRDVIVGDMIQKDVVILSGLQAGDSIVTAGLINVSDGVKVSNKN